MSHWKLQYSTFPRFRDRRGSFVKPFQRSVSDLIPKEIFYTKSHVGVCRGLHYQASPKAAERIMHVVEGEVLDFVVKFNPINHKIVCVSEKRLGPDTQLDYVIIPGDSCHCHGFISLKESTCIYFSSEEYDVECDFGYDLFSLPFDFSSVFHELGVPVIRSERDESFPRLF